MLLETRIVKEDGYQKQQGRNTTICRWSSMLLTMPQTPSLSGLRPMARIWLSAFRKLTAAQSFGRDSVMGKISSADLPTREFVHQVQQQLLALPGKISPMYQTASCQPFPADDGLSD